ncbi:hypothetical protein PFICI_04879 [Pestalotiopsis fici W106-1]|uniref:Uncharacterized protein n=1 Tax=Pestalotiopsis fici (strain W106-1 / CGMCC3.15140) TaxID=1229662 RepID=W3XA68_PESFW|nr:uncharacterized protein PFICI_04879 [Pestalotiopsis fici W106-1]ETS83003.1 hypothetical protein PFICI_04879 [Pestalotiopsis fici W106-1]
MGWWATIWSAPGQNHGIWSNDNTSDDLAREWRNPSVIIATILMLSGDSVIRTALAQTAGNWYNPVCFSFGWLSYSLSTLVDVFGDGKLLPPPDYPVKVFNLASGYQRENRNWIIGRIVRDHQTWISKQEPLGDNAIRITICEAEHNRLGCLSVRYSKLHILGIITMTVQFIVASIPTILTNGQEWGVLFVTAIGTLLAIIMGSVPQWAAEKLPRGNQSPAGKLSRGGRQVPNGYILTAGNGSRDVIVIQNDKGHCMNLEELSAHESPMNSRPWLKFKRRSSGERNTELASEIWGYPKGFFITLCTSMALAIAWLLLFITIPALRGHTWFFIMVGGIGLLHNAIIAGIRRKPKQRNLPLKYKDIIVARKVMDGLMDLEMNIPGCGNLLVPEFYPGHLLKDEYEWWYEEDPNKRKKTAYDRKRIEESDRRYLPHSLGRPDGHTTFGAADIPTEAAHMKRHVHAMSREIHMENNPQGSIDQLIMTNELPSTSGAEDEASDTKALPTGQSDAKISSLQAGSNHLGEGVSSSEQPRSVSGPRQSQSDGRTNAPENLTKAPVWD